jgi:hypothetical protein
MLDNMNESFSNFEIQKIIRSLSTFATLALFISFLMNCKYDSTALISLQGECPDQRKPFEERDGVGYCIKVACNPENFDELEEQFKQEGEAYCVPLDEQDMDAGSDMDDMTLDMPKDAEPDTPDMMDAGNDMPKDAEPDTPDMMVNDMTPDMNPCSQAMYDSANQLLGVLNQSKKIAPASTRYVGGGYGNYTFTCVGPVSEIFEGNVLDSMGTQLKVLEIKTPKCNSYWEFGPGNLGNRPINLGWQSEITPTYVEVISHGFYPNTQTDIPNQQAITLTMRYDRNTQELDGQTLCPELVTDIENEL